MKRQRSSDGSCHVSLGDVWTFLQNSDLSTDQLFSLGKEIDRLYSLKTNRIVQEFPSDMWLNIFSKTRTRLQPDDNTSIADDPHGHFLTDLVKLKRAETSFWLAARTVSKSWHAMIGTLDFSALVPIVPRCGLDRVHRIESYGDHHDRVLQLFHFSNVQYPSCEPIRWDLLTKVTTLHIPLTYTFSLKEAAKKLAHLTQLTSLSLGGAHRSPVRHQWDELHAALSQLPQLTSLGIVPPMGYVGPSSLPNVRHLTVLAHPAQDPTYYSSYRQMFPNMQTLSTVSPCIIFSRETSPVVATVLDGQNMLLYSGEWLGWDFHGTGYCYEADRLEDDRDEYYGQWEGFLRHGRGVMCYRDGTFLEGEWIQDAAKGGICVFPNGDSYHGALQRGKRHGLGIYIFADGTCVQGEWSQDECDASKALTLQSLPYTDSVLS